MTPAGRLQYFWAVQIWLLVVLFVYCSLPELTRSLGREWTFQIFFETPKRQARLGQEKGL